MPSKVTRWKNQRAAQKHSRAQHRQHATRQAKLSEMTRQIVAALGRSRNDGVVFADCSESVLFILATEIEYGPGTKTTAQREQDRRDVSQGTEDRRNGRRRLTQGDNQQLVRDAVELAIERGLIRRHIEADGTITALYLPAAEKTPLRWTAFLNKFGPVENYEPLLCDMTPFFNAARGEDQDERAPTGREQALLKRWGEQFSTAR